MDRVSFFSHPRLRRLFVCAIAASALCNAAYASTVQTYISDREVAIPTMFVVPGTANALSGDQSTADLVATVDNWVANFSYYAPMQQHLIINVANEWGPQNSATWASAYETAIARLRAAGYSVPIMIDAQSGGIMTARTLHDDPIWNQFFLLRTDDFHSAPH